MRERLRQLLADLDELPERQRGALVMRELAGLDFDAIAAALDTSPGVARQTLYEARLSLHQMDEGRDMDCATVTKALSEGDGRVTRRRDVRAHLRSCRDCQRFRAEIDGREQDFAALAPLPAAAVAGLLQGLLGGGAAGGGSSSAAGAAVAGGASKTLGSSAALKGAAAVLAIAAVGTGAAERGGLIDLGLPGDGGSPAGQAKPARSPRAAAPARVESAAQTTSHRSDPGSTTAAVKHHSTERPPGAGPAKAVDKGVGATDTKTPATEPAHGKASQHPHGKGHEKQHPAAAAHGQETAAAHKKFAPSAAAEEHRGQHAKPVHPEHPAHPSSGQEKTPPSDSAAAKDPAPEGPPAGAEEAAAQRGADRKPEGTGPR